MALRVLKTKREVRQFRQQHSTRKVGFVPTMGYLHKGHVSLAEAARKDCDKVIASIFVNPTQFAAHEDLSTYPQNIKRDLEMLTAAGVDAVFIPEAVEMYPPGSSTFVNVKGIEVTSEAKSRPHFFEGVATVVSKLFNIVQPDRAYFGQKDAIQCIVIKKMVLDLDFPIDVVICDTIREPDGLAMSSRNSYLSDMERKIAPVLYEALSSSDKLFKANVRDRKSLIASAEKVLLAEPRVSIDYLSLASFATGKEADVVPEEGAILSGAIRLGKTRLIDNLVFKANK